MNNNQPKRFHRESEPRKTSLGWGLLVVLGACQSYVPIPLDPGAHQAAWQARTLNDGSLEAFLEQRQAPLPGPKSPFNLGDGLNLHEARLVAMAFNPDLRLARLSAGVAAAKAQYAGRWSDPVFSISALRATDNIPDPWVVTPDLSFTLPISGRTGAESGHATAQSAAALAAIQRAEWQVWGQVWSAWQEWSAALQRVAETEKLITSLTELIERMVTLSEAGEVAPTEANRLNLEQNQQVAALIGLRGIVEEKEHTLRALMGMTPAAELHLVPYLSHLQEGLTGSDMVPLTQRLEFTVERADNNLVLAELRQQYEVAEKAVALEIAKQISDLTLGPAYESDAGQPRIGFVGGISLPLFHTNGGAIATARAERVLARARYETTLEVLAGRWSKTEDKIETLKRQRGHMEYELLPLIDQQLKDALNLMQLGEASSQILQEALVKAHEIKLEWIDATLAVSAAEGEFVQLRGPQSRIAPTPGEGENK